MKVYLAGGFYGVWKQRITKEVDCDFYDPETYSDQTSIVDYVSGDLSAIDSCDVVFAYLTSHPRYGGLAAEMGYAYAKGKPIIFVCTKDEPDGFLIGLSKYFCITLEAGIVRLKKLSGAVKP